MPNICNSPCFRTPFAPEGHLAAINSERLGAGPQSSQFGSRVKAVYRLAWEMSSRKNFAAHKRPGADNVSRRSRLATFETLSLSLLSSDV